MLYLLRTCCGMCFAVADRLRKVIEKAWCRRYCVTSTRKEYAQLLRRVLLQARVLLRRLCRSSAFRKVIEVQLGVVDIAFRAREKNTPSF